MRQLPWAALADLDFASLRRLQRLASKKPGASQFGRLPHSPASGHSPRAAINILTFDGQTGPSVLLLRKTSRGRHGGQLCFPGGYCNDGESDVEAAARELQEECGLDSTSGGGQVKTYGCLGWFQTARTAVDVAAHAGCFDHFAAVYNADICCGGDMEHTLGLRLDQNEADRAIGLPIEMLCDRRLVDLHGHHQCAEVDAVPGEIDWSGFQYEGPTFQLHAKAKALAIDNNSTQPVLWGLSARILAYYLSLLAEVALDDNPRYARR